MFFKDLGYEEEVKKNKQETKCCCGQKEDTIARKMREAEKRWRDEEMAARYRKIEDDIAADLYKKKMRKKYSTNTTKSQVKWILGVSVTLMVFFAFMDQVDKPDALDKERLRRSMRRGFNGSRRQGKALYA